MEEYTGDIIRIDRLIDFEPSEYWEWDFCGKTDFKEKWRYYIWDTLIFLKLNQKKNW